MCRLGVLGNLDMIRNRGNRNNGFYSWDYVDLGLNSAPATKNSGLRPLGLNSEIKTFNGPLVHFFFLLGLRLSFNGASSNIKFCETFETRLRVSSNMVDLMVIRECHSNFWCDLSKLGCKIHKKLPNMFGCKHNSTELASTELSTREFDT